MMMTTRGCWAAAGLAIASLAIATPARAFTLGYNGYFGSTNDPATGASATVDFTFADLTGGGIGMTLVLTNTTGQAAMTEGLLTDGATESEFLSVGFDWAGGDLASLLNIQSYTLGDPAFDELVYNDSSLTGGTSASTAIDGDGWGDVSLNDITFDIGLITSGNLLSTSSPRDGLNAGESETVTFALAPTSFANAAELEQWFVAGFVEGGYLTTAARFKAVDGTNIDGGSDKLLGGNLEEYFDYTTPDEPDEPDEPTTVPEPGAAIALGLAAASAWGLKRRA